MGPSVVLAKDTGSAQLGVAERAVVLELAWSTRGLTGSITCEGCHFALLYVEGPRYAHSLDAEYVEVPDRLVGEIVLVEEEDHDFSGIE